MEIAVRAVAVAHKGVAHTEVLARVIAGSVGCQRAVDVFLPLQQRTFVARNLSGAFAVAEIVDEGAGHYRRHGAGAAQAVAHVHRDAAGEHQLCHGGFLLRGGVVAVGVGHVSPVIDLFGEVHRQGLTVPCVGV